MIDKLTISRRASIGRGFARLAGLFVVFAAMVPAFAAEAASSPEERFQEANRAFSRGMEERGDERERWLRTSASILEELIGEGGVRNGYLYYNLGNAYQELGEVGRAILNYRRAERLVPGYENLQENLETAIRQRIDEDRQGQFTSIVRTLTLRSYWLDARTTQRVFGISFVAFWGLLGVALFRRPPLFRTLASILLVVSMLSGAAAGKYAFDERNDRAGVIVAEEADARRGAGRSYAAQYTLPLHEGTEFVRLGEQDGWLHIRLENDDDCWIRSADAEMVIPR